MLVMVVVGWGGARWVGATKCFWGGGGGVLDVAEVRLLQSVIKIAGS